MRSRTLTYHVMVLMVQMGITVEDITRGAGKAPRGGPQGQAGADAVTGRSCAPSTPTPPSATARDTLAEMAAAAFAAGVRYFGASGHSHTPIP